MNDLNGLTVLVVDDDRHGREVLRAMLEDHGILVIDAASGQQALAVLKAVDDVGVILVDVVLPGGGPSLVSEARRLRPTTPILLMSGYRVDDLSDAFRTCGATGFIQKPFDAVRLAGQLFRAAGVGVP